MGASRRRRHSSLRDCRKLRLHDFIQDKEIDKEMKQLDKERKAAAACGYDFVIGVSTDAHKLALLKRDSTFKIVVTGCKR
jgi:hypothetical protein